MTFEAFLRRVEADLDIQIARPVPCHEVDQLPKVLADFYAQSNGIELPFINIYPADRIDGSVLPGWFCFGADPYFSYALCTDAAIDLWDHDSGNEPEGSYSSVLEMLEATYRDSVEQSDRPGKFVLKAFPVHLRAIDVVPEVKKLDQRPSGEVLAAMRTLPFEVSCSLREGLSVARSLQAQGVACALGLKE